MQQQKGPLARSFFLYATRGQRSDSLRDPFFQLAFRRGADLRGGHFAILEQHSLAISSRAGPIILHGPHHSAQKSTTTGPPAPTTSDLKLASVTLTVDISFSRELWRGTIPRVTVPKVGRGKACVKPRGRRVVSQFEFQQWGGKPTSRLPSITGSDPNRTLGEALVHEQGYCKSGEKNNAPTGVERGRKRPILIVQSSDLERFCVLPKTASEFRIQLERFFNGIQEFCTKNRALNPNGFFDEMRRGRLGVPCPTRSPCITTCDRVIGSRRQSQLEARPGAFRFEGGRSLVGQSVVLVGELVGASISETAGG
jgi:hypothetical protein